MGRIIRWVVAWLLVSIPVSLFLGKLLAKRQQEQTRQPAVNRIQQNGHYGTQTQNDIKI